MSCSYESLRGGFGFCFTDVLPYIAGCIHVVCRQQISATHSMIFYDPPTPAHQTLKVTKHLDDDDRYCAILVTNNTVVLERRSAQYSSDHIDT